MKTWCNGVVKIRITKDFKVSVTEMSSGKVLIERTFSSQYSAEITFKQYREKYNADR